MEFIRSIANSVARQGTETAKTSPLPQKSMGGVQGRSATCASPNEKRAILGKAVQILRQAVAEVRQAASAQRNFSVGPSDPGTARKAGDVAGSVLNYQPFETQKAKNSEEISGFRRSKDEPDKPMQPLDEGRLAQIEAAIQPRIGQLKQQAAAAGGSVSFGKNEGIQVRKEITLLGHTFTYGKKETLQLGLGYTVTSDGKAYIHVPGSTWAVGGKKEVKVAVELDSRQLVVRSVGTSSKEKAGKTGDELILEKCESHPNVLRPLGITAKTKAADGSSVTKSGVLMPFVSGGSLRGKQLSGEALRSVALQSAKGIAHMHEKGLVHKDISSDNLLLAGEGADQHVVVFDFDTVVDVEADIKKAKSDTEAALAPYGGDIEKAKQGLKDLRQQAHSLSGPRRNEVNGQIVRLHKATSNGYLTAVTREIGHGTPGYKPPERTFQGAERHSDLERQDPVQFVKSTDVYALGTVLVELQTPAEDLREIPLEERAKAGRADDVLPAVQRAAIAFRDGVNDASPEMDKLIAQMLNDDPGKRPTMAEVVRRLETMK